MTVSNPGRGLDALLRPRAIAALGISEASLWCRAFVRCGAAVGSRVPLHFVRARGGEAFGQRVFRTCAEIAEPVDLAFFFCGNGKLLEHLEDAAAAGIRAGVVLAGGFAEEGPEGAARQTELVAAARRLGVVLLGPNSLGLVNTVDRISAGSFSPEGGFAEGPLAIVSQSGGVALALAGAAARRGIGTTFTIATGNEAMVDLGRILDFLVDDPGTKGIVAFAESVRDPGAFAAAAERALAARKPVVVLKIGKTEQSSLAARAHTGAVVGNPRVFEAACRRFGVLRAETPEEAVVTAALLVHTGPLPTPGTGIVSYSGGVCGLVSDAAGASNASLPAFSERTTATLRALLPPAAGIRNPVDLAGGFVLKPGQLEHALAAVGNDPAVGVTVAALDVCEGAEPMYPFIARGLRASAAPGLLLTTSADPLSPATRETLAAAGVPFVTSGVENAAKALAHAAEWSRRVRSGPIALVPPPPARLGASRPTTERAAMSYLGALGVPVAPSLLCKTSADALRAAMAFGRGPLALKIASPDILHKTDVGGVRLGLRSRAEVAEAFDGILSSVRAARPDARIEGVAAYPMRPRGLELFIGTSCDPQWGCTIAVGLGGVWVEALADTSVELLPVTAGEVSSMLRRLRGAAILDGFRGGPPIDMEAVASVIARIGGAALALGPGLKALEVNPLWVHGSRVEVLDARIQWGAEPGASPAEADSPAGAAPECRREPG